MGLAEKSIMIFGAGVNQLELIREARQMGIVTVVIDPQEDPPGKTEADFFYCVGGSDYETTKKIALRHNVNGIVTGQMEKPLRLMARLSEELGFIFNSQEVTDHCMDKWRMKESFRSGNIPCAEGILIRQGEAIPSALVPEMTFPLIIKPRDAFSSRGVYKCDNHDDVLTHLEESRYFSSGGDVLLEKFLEGREYSVEAITYQGETSVIQFTEKFITPYPNTVETGHLQPAGLSSPEKEVISSIVKKALVSLGIENSASHTEIMMTKSGPYVIETGARLGGDFIASYLTKASTGVSMDRAAIQVALGLKPDTVRKHEKYSMIRYIELPQGVTIKEVLPLDDIINYPGVVFAYLYVKQGDKIKRITHSALRPGCIIVSNDNKSDLLRLVEEMAEELKSRIIY
jgi:biotin carboxylase